MARRSRRKPPRKVTKRRTAPAAAKKKAAAEPVVVISRRRLWVYRALAATVVPVLVVLLAGGVAEVALRMGGYGYDPSATIEYSLDGEQVVADNVRFSERFFPAQMAREFQAFCFPAVKGPKTCRIFVLGASAAQGIPDGSYSFSRILEVLLREAYPEIRFEVINAGMTAINSHVVVPIARELAEYDPDVVVVYLGNNEVVGPYGAGTRFASIRRRLWMIRGGIALRGLRIGQWMAEASAQDADELLRGWGGMQMYLDHQVRADDRSLELVYRYYRRNLRDICRAATDGGAEVLLCTVGTNLRDCAPLASLHRRDMSEAEETRWNAVYEEAIEAEDGGRTDEALKLYGQAAEIDDEYADLHFRMARCLEREERWEEAGGAYRSARQYDTLRFRADETINETIRQVGAEEQGRGVELVDIDKLLCEHSENGLPGAKWFYEHVHLRFEGNYEVACALFERVGPVLVRRPGVRSEPKEAASIETCAARLAYTDADRYRLWKHMLEGFFVKPPFTNQVTNAADRVRVEEQVEQLRQFTAKPYLSQAVAAYREAIEARPEDYSLRWNLGILLSKEVKDLEAAGREFGEVQRLVPHFHRGYLAMGQVLNGAGKAQEALEHLQTAVALRPRAVDAHFDLGEAYRALERKDEALSCYQTALRCQADYMAAYYPLGELLFGRKRYAEAIELCRRGLLFKPNDALLHCNLGTLLAVTGNLQEARLEFNEALRLEPESEDIRARVRRVMGRLR